MRKFCSFLVLVGMFLIFSFSALAVEREQVMVDDKGQVSILLAEESPRHTASEAEFQAWLNPGKEYPMDLKVKRLDRPSFFSVVCTMGHTKVAMYDGAVMKPLDKVGESSGGEQFTWYIILVLVAMTIMVVSNILMGMGKMLVAFAIAVVAVTTVGIAAAVFLFAIPTDVELDLLLFLVTILVAMGFATLLALTAVFVVSFLVIVGVAKNKKKKYWVSVGVFYIFTFVILGYGWVF